MSLYKNMIDDIQKKNPVQITSPILNSLAKKNFNKNANFKEDILLVGKYEDKQRIKNKINQNRRKVINQKNTTKRQSHIKKYMPDSSQKIDSNLNQDQKHLKIYDYSSNHKLSKINKDEIGDLRKMLNEISIKNSNVKRNSKLTSNAVVSEVFGLTKKSNFSKNIKLSKNESNFENKNNKKISSKPINPFEKIGNLNIFEKKSVDEHEIGNLSINSSISGELLNDNELPLKQYQGKFNRNITKNKSKPSSKKNFLPTFTRKSQKPKKINGKNKFEYFMEKINKIDQDDSILTKEIDNNLKKLRDEYFHDDDDDDDIELQTSVNKKHFKPLSITINSSKKCNSNFKTNL